MISLGVNSLGWMRRTCHKGILRLLASLKACDYLECPLTNSLQKLGGKTTHLRQQEGPACTTVGIGGKPSTEAVTAPSAERTGRRTLPGRARGRGGEAPHTPRPRDQRRTSERLRPEPPRQARLRCTRSAFLSPATSWARPPRRRPSPGWCGTGRWPGKTALPAPADAAQTHSSAAHPRTTRKTNRRR